MDAEDREVSKVYKYTRGNILRLRAKAAKSPECMNWVSQRRRTWLNPENII